MPIQHEGRVEEQRCPSCGKLRPLDWYVPASEDCWKCRSIANPVFKTKSESADIARIRRNIRNDKRKAVKR